MGLHELWEVWEIKFLLLISLLLQVLLLIFTEFRRFVKWPLLSAALNGALWLLYQMADAIALYVLGHMSLKTKAPEQQQLMAFWASLLLVHLGGQDNITAYALEDNELWLRHLFTLVVQAVGAAYVLYKYVAGGSGALLAAAVLMFLVGVGKYLERIFALYSSGLENISKFLDRAEVPWYQQWYSNKPLVQCDAEESLCRAHDTLHVCMGQLVDYKVWPSPSSHYMLGYEYQDNDHTLGYQYLLDHDDTYIWHSKLLQMVGMQLSLTRDILYTKASVIHTWHGRVFHAFSTVSTVMAFNWFHQSTMVGSGYSKGDMVVTYILLAGAFFLELVSLLRASMSTWTCAWLRATGWGQPLHHAVVYLRRGFKVTGRCRSWPRTIGQHDMFQFCKEGGTGACYTVAHLFNLFRLDHWLNKLRFFKSVVISHKVEAKLLHHINFMVQECKEEEHILWNYRGQLALKPWGSTFYDDVIDDIHAVGLDGSSLDAGKVAFHGSILTWHYASDAILHFVDLCMLASGSGSDSVSLNRRGRAGAWDEMADLRRVPNMESEVLQYMGNEQRKELGHLAKGIRTLSRYMVFLLLERPHLLPGPVRRIQYDSFCLGYREFRHIEQGGEVPIAIRPAVSLATRLLDKCEELSVTEVLRVIFGVWVEMLCYAATHCSNDAHARQLGSSTELITVVWLVMTTTYNQAYRDSVLFKEKAHYFHERHDMRRGAQDEVEFTMLESTRALMAEKRRVRLEKEEKERLEKEEKERLEKEEKEQLEKEEREILSHAFDSDEETDHGSAASSV